MSKNKATPSRAGGLVMDTRHTGLNVNEQNPQKALGECFPACPHCRWIIDGHHHLRITI